MEDWTLGAIPAVVLVLVVLGIRKYRGMPRDHHAWRATASAGPAPPPEDMNWVLPPRSMSDAAAWDEYWRDIVSHRAGPLMLMFNDMFIDDGELVEAMRANGLKTVLCVGNGISREPHALQRAGFEVTALDLSSCANEVASRNPGDRVSATEGNTSEHSTGQPTYVTGDLCDPACCPGPYDVVIERRTLQLYADEERPKAMEAVAKRLAPTGIFVTHCHDGAWKPPEEPRHPTREWFVAHGWEVWYAGQRDKPLTGRVAWPVTTTG